MNDHHAFLTESSDRTSVERDDIVEAFQPLAGLLREVIDEARELCDPQVVASAFPRLRRTAHLKRLGGNARWMHIAEGIVERRDELPDGFAVESTTEQHNGGQYRFRFPGGLFTVKRTPHRKPEEGLYLQPQITGFEDVPVDPSIDTGREVVVFISAGQKQEPRLLVTHTTLPSPLVIELRELEVHAPVVPVVASRDQPRTAVRSTRKPAAEDVTASQEAE